METTTNATNPGGKWNIAIFLFFAFCIAFTVQTCHAQIWQNFKGIRLVNESDTAQQLSVQGSLFYDDVIDSLYLYNGTKWVNLMRTGGGSGGAFWPLGGSANFINNVSLNDNGQNTEILIGSLIDPINTFSLWAAAVDFRADDVFIKNLSMTSDGTSVLVNGDGDGGFVADNTAGSSMSATNGIESVTVNAFRDGTLELLSSRETLITADSVTISSGGVDKITLAVTANLQTIIFRNGSDRIGYIKFDGIGNTFTIGRGGQDIFQINNDDQIKIFRMQTACGDAGELWNDGGIIKMCP